MGGEDGGRHDDAPAEGHDEAVDGCESDEVGAVDLLVGVLPDRHELLPQQLVCLSLTLLRPGPRSG